LAYSRDYINGETLDFLSIARASVILCDICIEQLGVYLTRKQNNKKSQGFKFAIWLVMVCN